MQRAIRDKPLEEALQKKIAEQECYTQLVEIILGHRRMQCDQRTRNIHREN